MRLELLEVRQGDYTVIVDGKGFADRLNRDEALGVVAACLFGVQPPYLHTYEQWVARERKYRHPEEPYPQPVALLGCNTWSQQ
jgi:hypothetical protein